MTDKDDSGLFAGLGDFRFPQLPRAAPIPRIEVPLHQVNPAGWTFKILGEYIKDFESQLDAEHEVGARLVNFGQTVTFHIEKVGYYGPEIISFEGTNASGERVQLVQHMSQLSVLLVAMKKLGKEPRRIGFLWEYDSEEQE